MNRSLSFHSPSTKFNGDLNIHRRTRSSSVPPNTSSRSSSSKGATSPEPSAPLSHEIKLAINALQYAQISCRKLKLHTQLSILSVWPGLIKRLWQKKYLRGDFTWKPETSVDKETVLWKKANDSADPRTRPLMESLMEEYYRPLINKTIMLLLMVQDGLHDKKKEFKAYLTDLLNIWEILARLAIYYSVIAHDKAFFIEEDEEIFDRWDRVSVHIADWIKCQGGPGLSLSGLLLAERGKCFSIRLDENRFLFTMHNPKRQEEKTVWRWSFPALVYAESFPKRSEVLVKVKSVINLTRVDMKEDMCALGPKLLTWDFSLRFIRRPFIIQELSNWNI